MIPKHPRRRRLTGVAPAAATTVLAMLLAASAAGSDVPPADAPPAAAAEASAGAAATAEAFRPTAAVRDAEADREAKAARDEAAREKALLDGTSTRSRSWQLDKRMLPNDTTGKNAETILARMLKPRTDSWADWSAPLEPLHHCGEPRALPPRCVPPPPGHPSQPPHPFDLVGVAGEPSGGPIYDGPCAPRTGTHDHCPHHRARRAYDRFFDWFYMWK